MIIERKYNTIIIGAGISGCILGKILSDYVILEKSNIIGGEMNNIILGPKLYHSTNITNVFFKNYIKSIIDIQTITLLDSKKCVNKAIYDSKIGYTFKNSQNSSLDKFKALDINLNSFYEHINIDKNIKILNIDINNKKIYCLKDQDFIIYNYNYLISTIDFEVFIKLCNLKNEYDTKKRGIIYLHFLANYKKQYQYLQQYNFWYNLTNKEFFRCTNLKQQYMYTIELFPENIINYKQQIDKYFDYNSNMLEIYYNPNAKIWCNGKQILYNIFKTNNIYLLGRNALYNHDRIQDVIKSAEIIKEENNL